MMDIKIFVQTDDDVRLARRCMLIPSLNAIIRHQVLHVIHSATRYERSGKRHK